VQMKKASAFSFMEIIIVLSILCFVLLGFSAMAVSVMGSTSRTKEAAIATTLVKDKMQTLKNTAISSLVDGSDTIQRGNVSYRREWRISSLGDSHKMSVTVNWGGGGDTHSIGMSTERRNDK